MIVSNYSKEWFFANRPCGSKHISIPLGFWDLPPCFKKQVGHTSATRRKRDVGRSRLLLGKPLLSGFRTRGSRHKGKEEVMKVRVVLSKEKVNHRDPGSVFAKIGLTAPEIEETNRKPIDLVIVLDISSSMMSSAVVPPDPTKPKIRFAKEAALQCVKELLPTDRVAFVVFDDTVETLASLEEMTDGHRALVNKRIKETEPRGSTDLLSAILRGISIMENCRVDENRTRRIIVFTDGEPTAGTTDHGMIINAVSERAQNNTPITTLGFGATGRDYDPELLNAIARAAFGSFYHAEGEDGILQAFALEFGALRSAAASEVEVVLTPGNGIKIQKVLGDFRVSHEGENVKVMLGNVYGGETQNVVAELELPPVERLMPREVRALSVLARGTELEAGRFEETLTAKFEYVKPDEADAQPNVEVEEERLRFAAADIMERAINLANQGNHQEAAKLIGNIRRASENLGTTKSRTLALNLEKVERDIGDRGTYNRKVGTMRATTTALRFGRAAGSDYVDNDYTTESQTRTLVGMTREINLERIRALKPGENQVPKDIIDQDGRPVTARGTIETEEVPDEEEHHDDNVRHAGVFRRMEDPNNTNPNETTLRLDKTGPFARFVRKLKLGVDE